VGEGVHGGTGGAGFALGSRIAGYCLDEKIGAGGMAVVVFQAGDKRLDRLVVVKIPTLELGADEAFRHRFLRKPRAAAAVDDPHAVPEYEAAGASGVLFTAKRYVSGGR
jgi:hypothetical protein